eukprot:TRINITY_DN4296_c0_g1_i3.p1 TRINITY_DN4296_c0_g1~~TRINITY_DN4296_c0_g1_i3.p1  ORF type:complete len:124 (-),score=42.64 TRINITY_DN4296_c0_g1_i3:147-494(-)
MALPHAIMLVALLVACGPALATAASNGTFASCAALPVLNNTCTTVNITSASSSTAEVTLSIGNTTYLKEHYPVGTSQLPYFCLTQSALLSLMSANAELKSYSAYINSLIAVRLST